MQTGAFQSKQPILRLDYLISLGSVTCHYVTLVRTRLIRRRWRNPESLPTERT